MRFLEKQIDRAFHHATDGRVIFRPFWGTAYLVPSAERETDLRAGYRRFTIAAWLFALGCPLLSVSRPNRCSRAVVFDGLACGSRGVTLRAAGGHPVVLCRWNLVALADAERSHDRSSTRAGLLGSASMDPRCSSRCYPYGSGVHGGRRWPCRSRFCRRAAVLSLLGPLGDTRGSELRCSGARLVSVVPGPHVCAGAAEHALQPTRAWGPRG